MQLFLLLTTIVMLPTSKPRRVPRMLGRREIVELSRQELVVVGLALRLLPHHNLRTITKQRRRLQFRVAVEVIPQEVVGRLLLMEHTRNS